MVLSNLASESMSTTAIDNLEGDDDTPKATREEAPVKEDPENAFAVEAIMAKIVTMRTIFLA